MSPPIEPESPSTWQQLEARVAQILIECGFNVEEQKPVDLARGSVNVDVYAREDTSLPHVLVVECKNWNRPVTKTIVHAFRTVVEDSGANLGMIVSAEGYQEGAREAAKFSNIRLEDWLSFQGLYVDRWYTTFMAPRLRETVDPLLEYTEPINSRIFRKADALPESSQDRFRELREKYAMFAWGLYPLYSSMLGITDTPTTPELPLRATPKWDELVSEWPQEVLDATALRTLLDALISAYESAIREFDEVFGGRA